MTNSSNILDKKWHKQVNADTEIDRFIDQGIPKLIIDDKNRKLTFKYERTHAPRNKEELEKFFRLAEKSLENLEETRLKLEKDEPIDLIKNFYIDRIENQKNTVERYKVIYDNNISIEEKNSKLIEIHKKLYPLPSKNDFTIYINEFILFLIYLYENALFKVDKIDGLEELLDHSYYGVEKIDPDFNPAESIKLNEFFHKTENKDLSEDIQPKTVKKVLKCVLEEFGLDKESKLSLTDKDIFSVSPKREVSIPKSHHITKRRFFELVSHEILVHVYRPVLGKNNTNEKGEKIKFLEIGRTPKISATEEGLGIFFEQNLFYKSDKQDVCSLIHVYLRTIAAYLAMNFEPYEVYMKLEKLYKVMAGVKEKGEEYAFRQRESTIMRLYRDYEYPTKGCINGRVGIYLHGNRQIWNFIEKGGNIFNLFAGKIGFEEIDELKKLGFAVPEDFMGHKEFPREMILEKIKDCFN